MITESPLKLMKNTFYFTLKALSVLKVFMFLSWLFGHVEKTTRLERLIWKSMTSQPGQQTIAMHILPNIWRSKGNQSMAFGQLIEYNMRNIFVEKSYRKSARETIPRPLPKKPKLRISLDQ